MGNKQATTEYYAGELLLVGVNYDKGSKKHECLIERQEK